MKQELNDDCPGCGSACLVDLVKLRRLGPPVLCDGVPVYCGQTGQEIGTYSLGDDGEPIFYDDIGLYNCEPKEKP